jgi:hypothetical protein
MAENEKATKEHSASKKKIRGEVYAKLNEALAEYKNGSPEKEFSESIKKASKILAKDFLKSEKKSGNKGEKSKKKPARKKTKQEAKQD